MVIIPTFQAEEKELEEKRQNNLIVSKETFAGLIRKKIFPELFSHEEKRKKVKKQMYLLWVSSVILLCLTPYGVNLLKMLPMSENEDPLGVWLIFSAAPTMVSYYTRKQFLTERKDAFLSKLLAFLGTFKKEQETINANFLENSLLFNQKAFSFRGVQEFEESFTGHYKSTKFSVAETLLQYKKKRKKAYYTTTVFDGVVIAIDLKKNIVDHTLCYNEKFTFNFKHLFDDLDEVELEDEEFMKEYNIYSNNQIEARSVLKPVVMERIKKLKTTFNTKRIDIAIFNNHLMLAIHTTKNLFEPFGVFKSLYGMKNYFKFYDEIHSVCALIDTLEIDNERERLNLFK